MLLLGALSATTALLAACSSSLPPPLGDGGIPGVQCVTARESQPTTNGLYDMENSGTSPVTVQSISLGSPHGLTMTRAWLVPILFTKSGGFTLIGVGLPYPPTTSEEWSERQPAKGAVIGPGQDLNLVFGLIRTTTKDGTSAGPVIVYTANGNSYTLQEQTDLIVSKNCLAIPAGMG
jgi:hypothetical protein